MQSVFFDCHTHTEFSSCAEDVTLHVALANPAARRLYEKLGMRPVMHRMYRRL